MDDPENRFGPAKESPYDAYVAGLEALATQRQPTPPPRPVITSTARATSNKENTGPKPKPLTRATYQQKLALAKALTKLQEPSSEAKTKTRRKLKPQPRAANVEKNDEDTEVEDEDGTDVEGSGESNLPLPSPRKATAKMQTMVTRAPTRPRRTPVTIVRVPDNDNAAFDDFYSDEEKTWNPTRAELQAQYHNDSEDEDEKGDLGPAVEEAEEEPVKATTSKTASAFVVWKDGDTSATHEGAEDKASAPKRAPLGPKRVPSAMPNRYVRTNLMSPRAPTDETCRNLKRDRDEGDDEDSEGGDEENDENKDSWVPSKKRRVSGYYGTSMLVTVLHPSRMIASQAEDDHNKIHEDNGPSVNRPLPPIFERPSSEERESEEIEELLSFIEESPAGSPEPIGDTSVSVHLDGFDDNDVEIMPAPAPPAATFAPALAVAPPLPPPVIAPLLPSPVIVPSVRARRPRALGRDVVTVVGNRQIVYGQVFEDGKEV
ncbi:hypothetical protein FA13DRAFT_1741381 [Coprinellus micaceus]|uniref:Uncharacterized protein n=1 Tax=Coprinellus micaceus TaxID=71717 RepID=A0A4Y7SK13_COPMI|nr:hypothetical protein FA13DRAFT_1741381 [Coprinellus micaceus]